MAPSPHPQPHSTGYRTITAIITLLLFIDGFDLFLLGRIAPAIAAGLGHRPQDMALVFSFHQAGLAVGAFLMPIFADRYGHKRLLIIMCVFIGIASAVSSVMPTLESFALSRGFTGIFIAGILPIGLSFLSEHLPASRLSTYIALAMVGMSAGGAANAISAAWLLDRWGWQSGIWLGAIMPILAVPLIIYRLQERNRFNSRAKEAPAGWVVQISQIFRNRRAPMTLMFWLMCFITMAQTALLAAWLPTFFQELGGISIQRFAVAALLSMIGGTLGTVAIGWMQDRIGQILATALAHIGHGLGLIILGFISFGTVGFVMIFILWSFLQAASITGLNILLLRSYPIEFRSTGSGWAASVGRVAGVGAPVIGAVMLTTSPSLPFALTLVSLPMFFVALIILPLLARTIRRAGNEQYRSTHAD